MAGPPRPELHRFLKWFWWAQLPLYLACALDALLNETWQEGGDAARNGIGLWWDEYRLTMLTLVYIAGISIVTAAVAEGDNEKSDQARQDG